MNVLEVKVAGSSGNTYTVKQGRDGVIYCSCASWRFQQRHPAVRSCKHVRGLANRFAAQVARG